MTEVSSTRLYLGNLPRNATKADVEAHFQTHGTGEITEIKLMNGFGFIEYKDAMDARDVVPGKRQRPNPPTESMLTCASLPYVPKQLTPNAPPDCHRWIRLHGRAPHRPIRAGIPSQRKLHPERARRPAPSPYSVQDEDCQSSRGDQLAG